MYTIKCSHCFFVFFYIIIIIGAFKMDIHCNWGGVFVFCDVYCNSIFGFKMCLIGVWDKVQKCGSGGSCFKTFIISKRDGKANRRKLTRIWVKLKLFLYIMQDTARIDIDRYQLSLWLTMNLNDKTTYMWLMVCMEQAGV